METLHDVLRLLVAKGEGGRILPEEAEQAHAIINQHQASGQFLRDVRLTAKKPKKTKGGVMSETVPDPVTPDEEPETAPEEEATDGESG